MTPRRTETRRVPQQPTKAPKRRKPPSVDDIDPLVVQAERRDRISKTQDEEEKWAILKRFLRGEFDKLTHEQVSCASKIVDRFILSDDGVFYYLGRRRESRELPDEDLKLRLVVPTTLIDAHLLNCHDSMEGGHQGIVKTFHRVKSDFY